VTNLDKSSRIFEKHYLFNGGFMCGYSIMTIPGAVASHGLIALTIVKLYIAEERQRNVLLQFVQGLRI
jgi:hypothetical protein